MRGYDMKSTEKDRFTFREIAEQWVREVAGTPSVLSRDEILHGLLRSVWRGDFEDEDGENTCLAIHRYPKGGARRIDGKFVDADHQRTAETRPLGVNRRWLLRALALDRPHGLPLPPGDKLDPWSRPESDDPKAAMRDPALWSEVKAEVRWDILDALTLDEYSHMFRTSYLEQLTISKEDFGRWCDNHGHERPAFWFGDAGQIEALRVHRGATERDQHLRDKLVKAIQAADKMRSRRADLSDERIAEILASRPEISYSRETLRKIIRGTYPSLKRLGIVQ